MVKLLRKLLFREMSREIVLLLSLSYKHNKAHSSSSFIVRILIIYVKAAGQRNFKNSFKKYFIIPSIALIEFCWNIFLLKQIIIKAKLNIDKFSKVTLIYSRFSEFSFHQKSICSYIYRTNTSTKMNRIASYQKCQIIFDLIGCVSLGHIISYNNHSNDEEGPTNMQDLVSFPQRQTRRVEIASITAFNRLYRSRDSPRRCIWCGKISSFLRMPRFLRIARRILDPVAYLHHIFVYVFDVSQRESVSLTPSKTFRTPPLICADDTLSVYYAINVSLPFKRVDCKRSLVQPSMIYLRGRDSRQITAVQHQIQLY